VSTAPIRQYRVAVGKDADNVATALDLLHQPLKRVGGVDLPPVGLGEGKTGQDLVLRGDEQLGRLWPSFTECFRDVPEVVPCPLRRGLQEDHPHHRRHHALGGLGHLGEQVAEEVHPAPLKGGAENPTDSLGKGSDAAFGAYWIRWEATIRNVGLGPAFVSLGAIRASRTLSKAAPADTPPRRTPFPCTLALGEAVSFILVLSNDDKRRLEAPWPVEIRYTDTFGDEHITLADLDPMEAVVLHQQKGQSR